MNALFRSRLAIKHAKITMLAALCLGLLISITQIVYDAVYEKKQLDTDLSQVMAMFEAPLVSAIFDIDENMAITVINGLFHHPGIQSAKVVDSHGAVIAQKTRAELVLPRYWLSAYFNPGPFQFQQAIIDPVSKTEVGYMQLEINEHILIDRLINRAIIVFSSGLVRNTLLSLIFLVVFYVTLTLPLLSVIRRISAIDPERPCDYLLVPPKKQEKNEIGQLVRTINQLLTDFDHTLKRREEVEERLVSHQMQLEQLVQERTQALESANSELKDSFHRLVELERHKGVSEERERIMRDMHDGIGGLLISTLSMVGCDEYTRADIEQSIRATLTDLRLIIDSLDSAADDLNTCLGMFRTRIQPQLEIHKMTFRWQVANMGDDTHYGSEARLQLVRILQEFVTNSIKYSGADNISLSTHIQDDQLNIHIADNGCGFDLKQASEGRGLYNMQFRAEKMGATATLTSSAEGTALSIVLPKR